MNTFIRFCYETIIYCTCFSMTITFYKYGYLTDCIFALLIIAYFTYRMYGRITNFDCWGANWNYSTVINNKKQSNAFVYPKTNKTIINEIDEIKNKIKLNNNGIQLIETINIASKQKILEKFNI